MDQGLWDIGHYFTHSNLETKKKLNDLIKKRDFWMPFTPSVLSTDLKIYKKS